jgi:hypothetical protein
MDPVVYTLALTPRARTFCDSLAKSGMEMTHFESFDEVVEAITRQAPTGVIIHGSEQQATLLENKLRSIPGAESIGVLAIARFYTDDDDNPFGTAAAVMTVFDTMPATEDGDPWIRQPI